MRAINPGELDTQITIQALTQATQDSYGALVDSWADEITMWSRTREQRNIEEFSESERQGWDFREFLVRYRSGLNPKGRRISYLSRYWDITGISPMGRNQYLKIMAKARAE